ncbi:MAG: DNA cytosine methyltransferase [candidate division Zixibacteria bacterium]|nr:DNA cytosine methyltransferase [candidate division Zixibacteria bacterium]
MNKIILDLCGGTGAWSVPYKKAGYDVRLITLPDIDIRDYSPLEIENVHGILFAPPCTVWANSGARWWKDRTPDEIFDAAEVLMAGLRTIYHTKPIFWAIENPIGKMRKLLGDPQFSFNPCDFGDPYTKRTYLWGKFNPPIKNPVEPTEGSKMTLLYGGKSERTKRLRSITPSGFANAFFEANK